MSEIVGLGTTPRSPPYQDPILVGDLYILQKGIESEDWFVLSWYIDKKELNMYTWRQTVALPKLIIISEAEITSSEIHTFNFFKEHFTILRKYTGLTHYIHKGSYCHAFALDKLPRKELNYMRQKPVDNKSSISKYFSFWLRSPYYFFFFLNTFSIHSRATEPRVLHPKICLGLIQKCTQLRMQRLEDWQDIKKPKLKQSKVDHSC